MSGVTNICLGDDVQLDFVLVGLAPFDLILDVTDANGLSTIQNYQLDGIHFDYIRYHAYGWGMNPIGLNSFLNHSSTMPGLPSLSLQKKPKFSDFKKSAISA